MKVLIYVGWTTDNVIRCDANTMAELAEIARRDSMGGPVIVRIEGGMTLQAVNGKLLRPLFTSEAPQPEVPADAQ